MSTCRRLWVSVILTATICTLAAGCADQAPPAVREFPAGDSVAAARPLPSTARVVPRGVIRPIIPAHLYVPSVRINASVLSLGTVMESDAFLGGREVASFEVPPDLARVGWWSDGPRVGAGGMAVLLGHSQVGGGYAVFNDLVRLAIGAEVTVVDESAEHRIDFVVSSVVRNIPKDDDAALRTVLATNAPRSSLALITCSGNFDPSVSESVDNTVVFARRA